MKTWIPCCLFLLAAVFAGAPALQAQSSGIFLDCNCLLKLPGLQTNACAAVVPDLCAVATNCYRSTLVPPSPLSCSQSPTPGTVVGPGTTTIAFTITDMATGQSASCAVSFVVNPLPACAFTLLCASNLTVECGNAWSFTPPAWTNNCAPPPGTPSNGVSVVVLSTVTNGYCPQTITRTWQATDDCGNHAQCSQTVTIVDTTAPQLTCACITNNAVMPVQTTVYACASTIPDLCFPARFCAYDACGISGCAQSPPAGTPVGPGVYPITVTVYDCASNTASCTLNFTVIQPPGGCTFTLLCSSNQTVECGNAWSFTPPAWTNNCAPPPGTPSNGVSVVVLSTVTNGYCPQTITRTWQATDDCGNSAQCSQSVTIVDTIAPQLTCACLTNNAAGVSTPLTVYGCTSSIPDLCLPARTCAYDACGITGCTQSPTAGTPVGPGVYPITVTVYDCASNAASCTVNFTVLCTNCTFVPVLHLFSGATNNVPGVLPGGAADPQFQTGPPLLPFPNPYVPTAINGWWIPNNTVSKWVGPSSNYVYSPGGVYYYNARFFLCSTNQVALVGRWAGDDSGQILLNNVPTGNQLPNGWAFTNWTPVSITSGFVAGWNTLTFAITNGSYTPTGLRTEISGRGCCNQCVTIGCPPNILTNTCGHGAVVNYPAPTASSTCGNIVSLTSSPPSGSVFPIGTTVVTCTAIDSQGNAATCSFNVTVQLIGTPVAIKCPPDQILYTCGTSAVAYYHPYASGNIGPVVCSPPSGSSFPLGTNYVTCTATNACGNVATCTFRIIVRSLLTGPPSLTYLAGLPDNFVLPTEPAAPSACLLTAMNNFPYWKPFDATPVNTLFGYRFTGLPNTIVQGQLVIRMKPENDGYGTSVGSDNDGLFIGLTNCPSAGWAYVASIKTLPGTGGTWWPTNPPVTFTNNLSAAVIAHMNSVQHLDVMVHDDTTVDYMQLRLWTCPPPINPNGGVPHWTTLSANPAMLSLIPQPELPAFGPVGRGPCLSVSPPGGDVSQPNTVQVGLGGGQAFGFTTILDMTAPDGAQIAVGTPADDGTTTPLFTLVKSCQPRCHWDIKMAKLTDFTGAERSAAVNTNGDLLDSFAVAAADIDTDSLLSLEPEAGVDQFPVSFLLDSVTGEVTVTYPGSVARRLCGGLPCPRGWDGTIKGRLAGGGRKGWDGTVRCPCFDEEAARVVVTPVGLPPQPPRSSLLISSTGLNELVLAGEHLYTLGQEVTGADDSPLIVQGTTQGDGVSFAAVEDYSGVVLDLGHSATFDVGIHHFENGDLPTEEQLFRIGGPRCIGCLTNRPPPPPIDLRLTQWSDGVGAAIDFSGIGATALQVQVYSNGAYIAYADVPGPAMSPDEPLVVDHWPERLSLLAGNGVVRVTSSTFFNIQGFLGDEVRFVPTLPPDAPPFTYASELECRAPAGMESLLYDLRTTSACVPATLNATPTTGGTAFTWSGEGYRLLGAETLNGPWIELGVSSPAVIPADAPQRFFRLVCQ